MERKYEQALDELDEQIEKAKRNRKGKGELRKIMEDDEDLVKGIVCPACGTVWESLSQVPDVILEKSLVEGSIDTLDLNSPDLEYQCADCGCQWTRRIMKTLRKAEQSQEQIPKEGKTLTGGDREEKDEDEDDWRNDPDDPRNDPDSPLYQEEPESEEYAKSESDPWGKIFDKKKCYLEQFEIAKALGDDFETADANLDADEYFYYEQLDAIQKSIDEKAEREEQKALDEAKEMERLPDLKKKKRDKHFENTAEHPDDRRDDEEFGVEKGDGSNIYDDEHESLIWGKEDTKPRKTEDKMYDNDLLKELDEINEDLEELAKSETYEGTEEYDDKPEDEEDQFPESPRSKQGTFPRKGNKQDEADEREEGHKATDDDEDEEERKAVLMPGGSILIKSETEEDAETWDLVNKVGAEGEVDRYGKVIQKSDDVRATKAEQKDEDEPEWMRNLSLRGISYDPREMKLGKEHELLYHHAREDEAEKSVMANLDRISNYYSVLGKWIAEERRNLEMNKSMRDEEDVPKGYRWNETYSCLEKADAEVDKLEAEVENRQLVEYVENNFRKSCGMVSVYEERQPATKMSEEDLVAMLMGKSMYKVHDQTEGKDLICATREEAERMAKSILEDAEDEERIEKGCHPEGVMIPKKKKGKKFAKSRLLDGNDHFGERDSFGNICKK